MDEDCRWAMGIVDFVLGLISEGLSMVLLVVYYVIMPLALYGRD
jgi:hypothetical protein